MTFTPNLAMSLVFWIAFVTFVGAVGKRSVFWTAGRREEPIRWEGLFAIPKRYFVDLHHVVARDPYIARTHVAAAGGAIAAMLLVAVNYGLFLYLPFLNVGIAIFAFIMTVGVFFAWLRRRTPPSRLSKKSWQALPLVLATFAFGLFLLGAYPLVATSVSWGMAVVTIALLVFGAWHLSVGIAQGKPMKHAVAGLLHLAFHPRPQRFSSFLGDRAKIDQPITALKPISLDTPTLGVSKPVEFRWNQLLSFDACVQCGKCEAACPAFAAGQPLNPKKLVQDMVVGMVGGSDAEFAGSPYPGMPLGEHQGNPNAAIVPDLLSPQTLWSCTTCRACVQACPMLIEHVDAIVDMRRHQSLVEGNIPGKGHEVLHNLRETNTAGGFDTDVRYNWAIDLNVRQITPESQVDVLVIVGEGGFDMRYQRTLRAFIKVLNASKIDFAILGTLETDTGDIARRLGDEFTFQKMAKQLIHTLSQLSFKRIVTADPHVLHSLRNEYPAFGGSYDVLHHTELMAELATNNKLPLRASVPAEGVFTYHDPCYLGRYNGQTEAPRMLLQKIGIAVQEMERNGLNGRCCGGGGGAPLTDIPGKQRIPDIRIHDARSVGANTVVVACPNCTAMLEGVVAPRPDIKDVAELVAAALEV